MPTVRYTVANGQIIAEKRTVRRFYQTDALGSVIGLFDSNQTKTDAATYWPYGGTRTSSGTFGSKMGFVGSWGCRKQIDGDIYMRARVQEPKDGRWLTVDPLWPGESAYGFVNSNPATFVDPSGLAQRDLGTQFLERLAPQKICQEWGEHAIRRICNLGIEPDTCAQCAADIIGTWWFTRQHDCNHPYVHCMACCILSRAYSKECALQAQAFQNCIPIIRKSPGVQADRLKYCKEGIHASDNARGDCHDHCIKRHPPGAGCPGDRLEAPTSCKGAR